MAVLKVSHGSFETQSSQRNTHDRLLRELAEALVAFRQTLKTANLWQQVLSKHAGHIYGGRRTALRMA